MRHVSRQNSVFHTTRSAWTRTDFGFVMRYSSPQGPLFLAAFCFGADDIALVSKLAASLTGSAAACNCLMRILPTVLVHHSLTAHQYIFLPVRNREEKWFTHTIQTHLMLLRVPGGSVIWLTSASLTALRLGGILGEIRDAPPSCVSAICSVQ